MTGIMQNSFHVSQWSWLFLQRITPYKNNITYMITAQITDHLQFTMISANPTDQRVPSYHPKTHHESRAHHATHSQPPKHS